MGPARHTVSTSPSPDQPALSQQVSPSNEIDWFQFHQGNFWLVHLQGPSLLVDSQSKVGLGAVEQAKAVGGVATAVDPANEVRVLGGAGDVVVHDEGDRVHTLHLLGEAHKSLVDGEAANAGILIGRRVRGNAAMGRVDGINDAVNRENSGGRKAGEDEGSELHFVGCVDCLGTSVCCLQRSYVDMDLKQNLANFWTMKGFLYFSVFRIPVDIFLGQPVSASPGDNCHDSGGPRQANTSSTAPIRDGDLH